MFDDLRVRQNEDGTFSMTIKGYKDTHSGNTFNVTIPRMKEFPITIDSNREFEPLVFSKQTSPLTLKNTFDWKLKIETQLLPDKNGAIASYKKRRKNTMKN